MTSYEKEKNVFTRNPMGGKPGDSEGLKEHSKGKANFGGGGHHLAAFPQDNVHGVDLPDCHFGGKMGGSTTSLEGQLTGASVVQRQTGKIKDITRKGGGDGV